MAYIVKSSLEINSTIIPWNEKESNKMINEKKEMLEKKEKEKIIKQQENLSEETEKYDSDNEKEINKAKAIKKSQKAGEK